MPSFGATIRDILKESTSDSRRALGNMMELGFEIKEGLDLTLKYRYPYLDSLRYLQHQLALHYTEADGTSPFYVGRERLMTTPNGWPIPHDAPFKDVFDFVILALDEGGIFNKWMKDWLDKAKKAGRLEKRRQMMEPHLTPGESTSGKTSEQEGPTALTIVHLQGPLLIWGIGLSVSGIAFTGEYFALYYMNAQ
ncbi:uncharacterized protein LOC135226960 [Macrobrachium nipponense]|uniref:uncharacterized protein LOC135226960 n=1 Tax=Macrobrachium nipponense TaxID=159736 RepID=UPI0030C7E48F